MSDPLAFPDRADARSVWVFTANRPDAAFEAFVDSLGPDAEPLATVLGVPRLDRDYIETFLPDDMRDYGLARYLTEANGMSADMVGPDAAHLDALTKPVVLVYAQALDRTQPDMPTGFSPRPPLSFVGRYDHPYDLRATMPTPEHPTARGTLPGPSGPAAPPAGLRRAMTLTLAALMALALIIWLLT